MYVAHQTTTHMDVIHAQRNSTNNVTIYCSQYIVLSYPSHTRPCRALHSYRSPSHCINVSHTSSKDVERWMSAKDPEAVMLPAECVQARPAATTACLSSL